MKINEEHVRALIGLFIVIIIITLVIKWVSQ